MSVAHGDVIPAIPEGAAMKGQGLPGTIPVFQTPLPNVAAYSSLFAVSISSSLTITLGRSVLYNCQAVEVSEVKYTPRSVPT